MKPITTIEELNEQCLWWRGIEPGHECLSCGGTGIAVYGSTATWRGGVGGAAMTSDVCDKCWGTGDRHKQGPNLRKLFGGMEPYMEEATQTGRIVGFTRSELIARSHGATAVADEIAKKRDEEITKRSKRK